MRYFWGILLAGLGFLIPQLVFGDQQTVTNPNNNANKAISAAARLDFQINVGKFIYFRVGTAGNTIDNVQFTLRPSIPSGAVTPVNGNNVGVSWDGTSPPFVVTASNNVLPIEMRSNAGQVSVLATVSASLASGSNTIPMSQITVNSSDANLPAPIIPATGTGASVNVVGTSFAGLVTTRSANWTFGYANTVSPPAGSYSGEITFTASTP